MTEDALRAQVRDRYATAARTLDRCCPPAAEADFGRALYTAEERGSHVGCIAGALFRSEYEAGLAAAGLVDVSVTFTHQVADGMHGAIIKATKRA
jgi:hypothetical protein